MKMDNYIFGELRRNRYILDTANNYSVLITPMFLDKVPVHWDLFHL